MPLLLQTPINVGALDSSNYTHIKIARLLVQPTKSQLSFEVEYGYLSNGDWVSGKFQLSSVRSFMISDSPEITIPGGTTILASTAYSDMMDELPDSAQEKIYDGASRVLYQWLLDNDHFDGTIV